MGIESCIPGVDLRTCALICEQNPNCQAACEATKVGLDEGQPFYPIRAEEIVENCDFANNGACILVSALVRVAAERRAV